MPKPRAESLKRSPAKGTSVPKPRPPKVVELKKGADPADNKMEPAAIPTPALAFSIGVNEQGVHIMLVARNSPTVQLSSIVYTDAAQAVSELEQLLSHARQIAMQVAYSNGVAAGMAQAQDPAQSTTKELP